MLLATVTLLTSSSGASLDPRFKSIPACLAKTPVEVCKLLSIQDPPSPYDSGNVSEKTNKPIYMAELKQAFNFAQITALCYGESANGLSCKMIDIALKSGSEAAVANELDLLGLKKSDFTNVYEKTIRHDGAPAPYNKPEIWSVRESKKLKMLIGVDISGKQPNFKFVRIETEIDNRPTLLKE